jgi:hypothetical protein
MEARYDRHRVINPRLLLPASAAVLALAAGSAPLAHPAAGTSPAALKATVTRAIAAEKAALKALDDPSKARSELEASLSDLKSARGAAAAAGAAAAVSPLGQAILGDEYALENLDNSRERGSVRAKINIAIVRKEAAETVFANASGSTVPAAGAPAQSMPIDAAKGIVATFIQEDFSTLYAVDQTNTSLYPATISWKLTPPAADPACDGFLPATGSTSIPAGKQSGLSQVRAEFYSTTNGHDPEPNVGELLDSVAIWWHADISERGLCNHDGNAYVPTQYGHGGLVSVTVQNKYWTCTASFKGTLTGGPGHPPDAAEPEGYPNGWRGPATCVAR